MGRSRAFTDFLLPHFKEAFPEEMGLTAPDDFYAGVNLVTPTLIRVHADELTYNLHVALRFELERALMRDELETADLPEAWNDAMDRYVGATPPDDRDGVLQDMHWFGGIVGGAFQGYTLGNILSAQFYDAALQAHPEITSEIERGEFGTLRGWLTEHIYRHGRKYTASELVERATGGPLSIDPYVRYLRTKFGELYEL